MQEIERKFLPAPGAVIPFTSDNEEIIQMYIHEEGEDTVCRLRLIDGHKALITQKDKSLDGGFSCNELESRIPYHIGLVMYDACGNPPIIKERYRIPHGELTFEVDVFSDHNKGLVLIEIEMPSKDTVITLPDWVGEEVTLDPRYKNVNLIKNPYELW
ncbi:CYTH domain protein [Vibrio phage 2.275.O._10N.286.54.E11]|nr:CYTH domain protein [Vibrio phage 2.275.O._10N.286.54.E11]